MNILGIRIDNLKKEEILRKIEFFLGEDKFHQIATVNPEFVLEAQKNQEFKNVLNNCALNIADGFGIKCAFWRYGKHLGVRIAGVDLMLEILRIANEKKLNVFLAINKDGLSGFEEIKKAILRIYPELVITGENLDINKVGKNCMVQVSDLNRQRNCDVLFCNFGAPNQEIFLNSQKNAKIRLGMGVGGSFDFLTKKVQRAPIFMRRLGLEWLWRIFQPQPWKFKKQRIKRIWKAVIVFPTKIVFSK